MPVVEIREITNSFEYEKECEVIVLSRKKISGTKPVSAERYIKLREEAKSNNSSVALGYFEDNKLPRISHFGIEHPSNKKNICDPTSVITINIKNYLNL